MKDRSLVFDIRCPSYYSKLDLEPLFNKEQLRVHIQLHQGYYNRMIEHIKREKLDDWSLEKIIMNSQNPVRHDVAQYWYHNMFWKNLTKKSDITKISKDLKEELLTSYGSLEELKACMINTAMSTYGNGWLICGFDKNTPSSIRCFSYGNSTVPMSNNIIPLIVVDAWEHSYFLQYKTDKKTYYTKIWDYLDWEEISTRYAKWIEDYSKIIKYCGNYNTEFNY